MSADQTCIVAIRTGSGSTVKAFDTRIRGEEVYTNYSDCSTPEAHASYHKSGQYHIKKGKKYIEWSGGPTGAMEPMKLHRLPPGQVRGRSRCWVVGWGVSRLDGVLPVLSGNADMIVDARQIEPDVILTFEADVVGPEAKKQMAVVGYPVIASHRFGNPVVVEICAFVVR
jgi:hypothetical protein